MKIQTVVDIEKLIPSLMQGIKNIHLNDYKDHAFGAEKECNAQSIAVSLQNLVTNCNNIVASSDIFVKEFKYQDRIFISKKLREIDSLTNATPQDLETTCSFLDELKPYASRLRNIYASKSKINYTEQTDILAKDATKLRSIIVELTRKTEKFEEAKKSILELNDSIQQVASHLQEIEQNKDQAVATRDDISASKNSIESMEDGIKKFFDAIEQREQVIEKQNTMLDEFTSMHKKLNKEAEEIITEAKNALAYGTRAGLSAAFSARVDEDNAKAAKFYIWLAAGIGFGLLAVVLGIVLTTGWLLDDATALQEFIKNPSWINIVARITITSIPFSAAWFCMDQFSRTGNLKEDYRYKAVVVQSMEAFLAQFKDNPEQQNLYLKTVFSQVFRDPLRKKNDVSTPFSDILRHFSKPDHE